MSIILVGLFYSPDELIKVGGLLLVLLLIYLETGVFLGLILPGGDYMLFATGVFCGSDYLDFPLFLVLFFVMMASVLGDTTGYVQGKWLGDKLFLKSNSRIFKRDYLIRSNHFYAKYKAWAFIMGRFIPIIRTFLPMLAGAANLRFKRFLLYDAIGAIIWVGSIISIGYYFGKKFPGVINYSVYILIGIIILASIPILKLYFGKK
jgi:membrane-associated protein